MASRVFDPSATDYKQVLLAPTFVDKTVLVKKIFKVKGDLAITAPSRFGKSMNLDMLRYILEIEVDEAGKRVLPIETTRNYRLLMGREKPLKIKSKPDVLSKFGKYLVLLICCKQQFQPINHLKDMMNYCKKIIHSTYIRYMFLAQSDALDESEKEMVLKWGDPSNYKNLTKRDVLPALGNLATYLCRHIKECNMIVLVDDYDYPTIRAMSSHSNRDVQECSNFFFSIFPEYIYKNGRISKTIYTGQFRIAIPSSRVVKHCEFMVHERFTRFYGFTFPEVRKLLDDFGLRMVDDQEITHKYGGYISRFANYEMFNCWSVLHFIQDCVGQEGNSPAPMGMYWEQYKECVLLRILLRQREFREKLSSYMHGQPGGMIGRMSTKCFLQFFLEFNSRTDMRDAMPFFMQMGYFSHVMSKKVTPDINNRDYLLVNDETTAPLSAIGSKYDIYEYPSREVKADIKKFICSFYEDEYGFNRNGCRKTARLLSTVMSFHDPMYFEELRFAIVELFSGQFKGSLKAAVNQFVPLMAVSQEGCMVIKCKKRTDLTLLRTDLVLFVRLDSNYSVAKTMAGLIAEEKWSNPIDSTVTHQILVAVSVHAAFQVTEVTLGYIICDIDGDPAKVTPVYM